MPKPGIPDGYVACPERADCLPEGIALPNCRGQAGTLGTGKRLLATMQRHAVWDRLTLWGGLAVFMLVVAYVVQKRSLYFVPR